jgi:hypothetical protein
VEVDPASERYAVFFLVDGVLCRIEIRHLLYIQFDGGSVKADNGAMCGSAQDSPQGSRYNRQPQEQGGNP